MTRNSHRRAIRAEQTAIRSEASRARFWRRDVPVFGDGGNLVKGGMFPAQRRWWDKTEFVRLFVGGYGAGKTNILCKRMIALALHNAPAPCAIVSPSYGVAKETTILTTRELLEGKASIRPGLHWDERKTTPHEFYIRENGKHGRVLIYSGEHPDKLKGPNLGAAGIDEPFIQDKAVFDQMTARVRHPKAKRLELDLTGCVTRDTMVVTPAGLRRIGDLDPGAAPKEFVETPGSEVMGVRGRWYDATKFYNNGIDDTITVTLSTGQSITATPDHPIMTMGPDGKYEFKRIGSRKGKYAHLRQLLPTDQVAVARGMDCWGTADPCAGWTAPESLRKADQPAGFGVEMNKDLAYFLGLWVAEGSYQASQERVTLTCRDQEPHDSLRAGLNGWKFVQASPGRPDQSRIYSEQLVSLMKHIGMPMVKASKKWVPDWVFAGRREWAVAFLSGLIDRDGHVTAKGTPLIRYTSTSKRLIEGVRMLLLNLGVVPRSQFTLSKPTKKVRVESARWQLTVQNQQAITLAEHLDLRLDCKYCESLRFRELQFRDSDVMAGSGGLVAAAWADRIKQRWRTKPELAFRTTATGTNSHEPNKVAERGRAGIPMACSTLQDFVAYWDANEPESHEAIEVLRANCADNYFWTQIESIEETGLKETVDFVIPETNTFVSNGLVSKQTPESLNWGYDLAEGKLGTKLEIAVVRASSRENEALPDQFVRNLLAQYDEKTVKAYLDGFFINLANGIIYHGFDRNENVVDLDIPPNARLGAGMDFNVNPMSATIFWTTGDHIHYVDEILMPNSDTLEMCNEIRKRYPALTDIYPDSNAGRSTNSPGGLTDYDYIRQAGMTPHTLLAGNPLRADRYNAANGMLKPASGNISCTISPKCETLIANLGQYTHENRDTTTGKRFSHILDAMTYPLWFLFPLYRPTATTRNLRGF